MTVNPVTDGFNMMNVLNKEGRGKNSSGPDFTELFNETGKEFPNPVNVRAVENTSYITDNNDSEYEEVTTVKSGIDEKKENNGDSLSAYHKDVADRDGSKQQEVSGELKDRVTNEAAKKLGISEEELIDILEKLGFGAADLCNTENIPAIVAEIFSQGDSLELITDENLSSLSLELAELINNSIEQSARELGITPDEMKNLVVSAANDESFEIPDVVSDIGNEDKILIEPPKVRDYAATDSDVTKINASDDLMSSQNTGAVKDEPQLRNNDSSKDDKEKSGERESEKTHDAMNMTADNSVSDVDKDFNRGIEEVNRNNAVQRNDMLEKMDIIDQIKDQIKLNFKQDMTNLQMQLNPENLGTVNLSVTGRAGGEVAVFMTTQNEAVQAALQSQIEAVKQNLEMQGVKVTSIEVSVESHSLEQNLEQGNDRNETQEEVEDALHKSLRRLNIREVLAGDGIEGLEEDEVVTAKMMEAEGNSMDYRV